MWTHRFITSPQVGNSQQLVKDEQQCSWDPGGDLSSDPVNGDLRTVLDKTSDGTMIYRSPLVREFRVPSSGIFRHLDVKYFPEHPANRANDLLHRRKLQEAMDTIKYSQTKPWKQLKGHFFLWPGYLTH